MDFNKYRSALIECISDCFPNETIPKKYIQIMSEIIQFVNTVENAINESVQQSMKNPIIQTLNDDEKRVWIQKMKEKAKIELLHDVSEDEYINFVEQLKECMKQWLLWGWSVPSLECYKVEIPSSNVRYEEMSEENFINWLLLNWLSMNPSIVEGRNCMSICVRTWFYPIIKSHATTIDTHVIKQVLDTYSKYEYITTMFPKEWDWKKESQTNIALYLKSIIENLFKERQAVTKSFIDLVEKMLEFQDAWNIVFNEYEISITDITADYVSKYIIPYFSNNLKQMEQHVVINKVIDEHIDDKLLGTIKGSIRLVHRLGTSHNILRLLHIYIRHVPNILKNIYAKRTWLVNIAHLETFVEAFNNIIAELLSSFTNEFILDEIKKFNEKMDWEHMTAFVLEECVAWKKLLDCKLYEDVYSVCAEWSADNSKKKFLRRFIQVWTNTRLDKFFHTVKKDKLEDELKKIGEFKNSLIEIENSETWIEPMELFLCKWLNYIKDIPNIKEKHIFDFINFNKLNKANNMIYSGFVKIKKIV